MIFKFLSLFFSFEWVLLNDFHSTAICAQFLSRNREKEVLFLPASSFPLISSLDA